MPVAPRPVFLVQRGFSRGEGGGVLRGRGWGQVETLRAELREADKGKQVHYAIATLGSIGAVDCAVADLLQTCRGPFANLLQTCCRRTARKYARDS